MAIVEMEKLKIYVHNSVKTDVFRVIQKMGVVHFVEIKDTENLERAEKKVFEFNYVSSRLDFAIEFLSRFETHSSKFEKIKKAIEGNKVFTTNKEVEDTANSFYFNDIVDRVQDIEEKINDTRAKIKDLRAEKTILSGWIKLNIPLGVPFKTKNTQTILLLGQQSEIDILSNTLRENKILFNVKDVAPEHFIFTILKENVEESFSIINSTEVERIELLKRRGTPAEEIERIDRAVIKNKSLQNTLEREAGSLTQHLPKLKMVGDRIFWKKEKHNLLSSAYRKNDILVFEGWCKKTQLTDLIKKITEETKLFTIEKIEPENDEAVPVEIQNKKLISPFEAVTRLYGLPGNKDIDPTPFLAGFFFIFFGLSLTDVGYGLFLFFTTSAFLFFFKIPKNVKPLIQLLMLGGISSFFVGLLFGGYFGINMEYMPVWLQSIQEFDPIANPLPVFYMALGFGVFQIMFGLVLKIARDAKNGALVSGLLDQGPWLALFLSLIFWGAVKIGFISDTYGVAIMAIYGALLFLVVTQGRKEKTFLKKIFKGVFSLYGSINYFSDILSYSRLLALGLATSALAFAVNLIATMVGDMVPYVGTVLMVVILIIGHLFNLAVNTLGAFIHSARLQFVEFFGKFITDNGKVFTPFKRDERYVVVE